MSFKGEWTIEIDEVTHTIEVESDGDRVTLQSTRSGYTYDKWDGDTSPPIDESATVVMDRVEDVDAVIALLTAARNNMRG